MAHTMQKYSLPPQVWQKCGTVNQCGYLNQATLTAENAQKLKEYIVAQMRNSEDDSAYTPPGEILRLCGLHKQMDQNYGTAKATDAVVVWKPVSFIDHHGNAREKKVVMAFATSGDINESSMHPHDPVTVYRMRYRSPGGFHPRTVDWVHPSEHAGSHATTLHSRMKCRDMLAQLIPPASYACPELNMQTLCDGTSSNSSCSSPHTCSEGGSSCYSPIASSCSSDGDDERLLC
eukprot:3227783-Rhodomonas_salina.2